MREYGAKAQTVTVSQSTAGSRLVGGPLRLKGWSLTDGTADQDLTVRQPAAAPAANATIASIALPNGVFTVEWSLEIQGASGAADVDNVALFIGATQIATSVNLGVVGNYPQANAQASVAGGPLTLAAKAVGNAAVGSTYVINMTIIPTGQSQATIKDGGQSIGFASMGEGRADTQWLGEDGVQIRTELSILATQGTVSGVLWIEEVYPTGEHTSHEKY